MPTTPNPYASDLADRHPLDALRDTPVRIADLTAAWPAAQFDRSYAPGKWTARQILIHLAQTELALGTRARMALSTSPYAAQAMNQDRWMARDAALTAREALDAFVAIAGMNRALFASLSDADKATPFTHPEYGELTIDWLMHQMAGHQIHHLAQLERIAQA
jgi:DinB superfamily